MHAAPSYVSGTSAAPLLGETIGACLDRVARKFPRRIALISRHQSVRWTFSELRERVNRLAAGLRRLGLAPGDRLGIWAPNSAEWALVQFATAKAGVILVNINPAYQRSELLYVLNKVGCRALVLAPRFKSSDYIGMLRELAPELGQCQPGDLKAARIQDLRTVILLGQETCPGMLRFEDVAGRASDEELQALAALEARLQFDDPINIQFTSGTTGAPKGATLTHHNILNNGYFVGEAIRLTEHDRLCVPVPLYHCFGMVMGNLGCVTHGAAIVYPAESFDPRSVLEAIQAEKCTALYGVPTMFIKVLDEPGFSAFDVSSLRTGIMAGSPCPIKVMRDVIERLHMPEVTIAYGMTETSPVSFQSSVDDPVERRVSTVGRIHPHVEVKVVDGEGCIAPRGQKGELLTRGYSVMRGYWGEPEKTAEAVDAAGWMHTGDLATLDAEGYCNIVGRSKDLVIRGGENIYPREVEEFLYNNPKIQDVSVVGVPDEKYGEELCACVIVKEGARTTEEEIRSFCKGQIAHYKVPKYVRFVTKFPLTATGKIQKYVLRSEISRDLGLKEQKTA
jgi:fatty-acyl-CoA synthase